MPFLDRPGARVAYTVSGTGPPLILGHSLFCTRGMWDGVLETIEEHCTVINVELRGHGESTAPVPFSLDDLVDDWLAILDTEGHESAICGGLSTGGFTAMRLALRTPKRVRGLILLDTSASSEPPMQRLQYRALAWLYQKTGFLPVNKLSSAMFGSETRDHHPERITELISLLRTFDRVHLGNAMNAVFGRSGVDLSSVNVPTLIAVGAEDHATPPHHAQEMARQIAGSELHTIPGAGHLSAVERPHDIARLMSSFLVQRECN